MAASLRQATELSPYGVDVRYPGDFPDVLPGEEEELFRLARRTKETVTAELGSFLSRG